MKKITFAITPREGFSMTSFIRDLQDFPCRIHIDMENNLMTFENLESVDNKVIDSMLFIVDMYSIIRIIDIDNIATTVKDSTSSDEILQNGSNTHCDSLEVVNNSELIQNTTSQKLGAEAALYAAIGPAFEKLDSSKPVDIQITSFLKEIGFNDSELVFQAFEIACSLKRTATFNLILFNIRNLNPDTNMSTVTIQEFFKTTFKAWLVNYPQITATCPHISFMALLKAFVKKIHT